MKNKSKIEHWKKHYQYVTGIVKRIDAGEVIQPDSIAGREVGQRQHCIDEANIAVDRLAELGDYTYPKQGIAPNGKRL